MVQNVHQVRAYGDEDFQWAFYLNQKYLDPMGIWPSGKKESRYKSLMAPLLLIIVLFGEAIPTLYAFIKIRHQLSLLIDYLLVLVSSWVAGIKIFFFWYYRPAYRSLMTLAKSDWYRCSEDWERQLVLKQAHRGRLLTKFRYISMFFHVNGFLLAPLFNLKMRIVNNITDPNPQRILPAPTYYPYKYYESPYYELTYLSQVIAIECAGFAYAAIASFFSVLVFHASGQCDIIAGKMRRLYDKQEDYQSFRDRCRELIKSHVRLIRFVTDIEKNFNTIIFIQMFGSIAMMCNVGYAWAKAIPENPPATQIALLAASIVDVSEHVFIYCLPPEILLSSSSDMFDGIYNSNWHNTLPMKEARYVTLIMMRTQYPLQLSAGKFFYLCLSFYLQMIKTTVGYISVLLAIS